MQSSATTRSASSEHTPISPTSNQQEGNDAPCPTQRPELTQDHYLGDTFGRAWSDSPHALAFNEDGQVKTYGPCPACEADRRAEEEKIHNAQRLGTQSEALRAVHPQRFLSKDPKYWKNVAISEQDDAEFEALEAYRQARLEQIGEWENRMYYENDGYVQGSGYTYPQVPPLAAPVPYPGTQQQATYPFPPPPRSGR